MHSDSHHIHVVVCDPCPMVFCGMQKSFESDLRIKIICEANDLHGLRNQVYAAPYKVAVIDWSLISWSDHESVGLLRELARCVSVVLMGMSESTRDRRHALDAGVRGIVDKRSSAAQMRPALLKAASGGIWLEAAAAERLLDHVFSPRADGSAEADLLRLITPREHVIIELVCRGLRNKQIAAELRIAETTVWHHLSSIFGKLKVSDRVSLVTFAFRHDLHSAVTKPRVEDRSVRFSSGVARSSHVGSLTGIAACSRHTVAQKS